MKQKMVIKTSSPPWKNNRRCKALEVAARMEGVSSTAVTGDDRDQLEAVGEGVDLICLVSKLSDKVGPSKVLLVEEIKDKKGKEKVEEKEDEEKAEKLIAPQCYWHVDCCGYSYPPPLPPPYITVYDDEPSAGCAIM